MGPAAQHDGAAFWTLSRGCRNSTCPIGSTFLKKIPAGPELPVDHEITDPLRMRREMRMRFVEAVTKKAGRWSRRAKFVSAVSGCVLVAAGAYAATHWVVGLNAGSSGEGQSATIANLSITAVASPAPGNVLFPGGTGDVVVTIANTNSYPVTITAVNLPTNATQAGGFTTSALSTAQTGCSTTTSAVTWNFATATGAANNPLVVTLTNDALMSSTSPAACANTFFSMPALTGVTATGGAATSTTSPATSGWTS